MLKFKSLVFIFFAISLLFGCDISINTGSNVNEKVEDIILPKEIASFELASTIGQEVLNEIIAEFNGNPEKYDPNTVGLVINWGETKNFSTDEIIYYIKITGKSLAEVEDTPEVLQLMQMAINSTNQKVKEHSR